jgi:hypothetical protein
MKNKKESSSEPVLKDRYVPFLWEMSPVLMYSEPDTVSWKYRMYSSSHTAATRAAFRTCVSSPALGEQPFTLVFRSQIGLQHLTSIPVLRIRDILVRIRIWTNGSGSDTKSGSGSCFFRQWPSRWQLKKKFSSSFCSYDFLKLHLHHFSMIKSHKESQKI